MSPVIIRDSHLSSTRILEKVCEKLRDARIPFKHKHINSLLKDKEADLTVSATTGRNLN
jgi:hypothetical protein